MRTTLNGLVIAALCCANAWAANDSWQPAQGPLKTRWAKDVSPDNAHPEYPRPQMVRKDWLNLNGLWDFAITSQGGRPRDIRCPDSGAVPGRIRFVRRDAPVNENERIWYRRTFEVPRKWRGRRVLLHFGAVDFEATVWVNGKEVGQHRGGYDAFSFDITDALEPVRRQRVDRDRRGTRPTPARNPAANRCASHNGIWYTPTSGIWQTVWLEPVNAAYIKGLKITPDVDNGAVTIQPEHAADAGRLHGRGHDARWPEGGLHGLRQRRRTRSRCRSRMRKLWSPEDPHLIQLVVSLKLGNRTIDKVESYFGMRKISLGKDEKGFTRLMLNNKPYFQFGPLDQGFWPDGLYTAPTDEALRYDIEMTKKLGFNLARKHVKVEPDRWYYWCDKLGLLVWQDMPSGDKYIGRQ